MKERWMAADFEGLENDVLDGVSCDILMRKFVMRMANCIAKAHNVFEWKLSLHVVQ